MPIERQRWIPTESGAETNTQLRRVVEVLDTADRVQTQAVTATKTVALTWPATLLDCDTTAGAVTVTFPGAATVTGFRVDAVKAGGANSLTVNGVTVTTYAAWVSTGAAWRRVG